MLPKVSQIDRTRLRDLSKSVAEIAADPYQDEMRELWSKLIRLERTRPLVLLHDGTGHETGQRATPECENEDLHGIECGLLGRIWHWENMRDDSIWTGKFDCGIVTSVSDIGIHTSTTEPDHVFGAAHYNTVIADGDDPTRLKMPMVAVDWDETERKFEWCMDMFGDILDVQKTGVLGYWFTGMDTFITWRGIEQTFIDMVDRPEWVHSWLERICDYHLSLLSQYEELGVLSLDNDGRCVGSGGPGYTELLPSGEFDPAQVRTIDQWGHATTQIFSEVSPAMHEEFALEYEKRILARFGLGNYGCCEPLDRKVALVLAHCPNVRKISMSPWADIARGSESIGRRAVFSWKPNPAILAVENWDVDVCMKYMRDAFEKTRDNVVEVVMKDLHTVRGEVHRMTDWVRATKELAGEFA